MLLLTTYLCDKQITQQIIAYKDQHHSIDISANLVFAQTLKKLV